MNTGIRNLSRLIWITLPEENDLDRDQKYIHIKLALGFAYAARHALLEEAGVFQDFEKLIPEDMKMVDYNPEDMMPMPFQIAYKV